MRVSRFSLVVCLLASCSGGRPSDTALDPADEDAQGVGDIDAPADGDHATETDPLTDTDDVTGVESLTLLTSASVGAVAGGVVSYTLRAEDAEGNGVAGASIGVSLGAGLSGDAALMTDTLGSAHGELAVDVDAAPGTTSADFSAGPATTRLQIDVLPLAWDGATPCGATAVVGSSVTVSARLVASGNSPVAGRAVTAALGVASAATLAATSAVSNADGRVSFDVTLATSSGSETLTLSAAGLPPLVCALSATPGPAVRLVRVRGGGTIAAGAWSDIEARAEDTHGNPVPGTPVVWRPSVDANGVEQLYSDLSGSHPLGDWYSTPLARTGPGGQVAGTWIPTKARPFTFGPEVALPEASSASQIVRFMHTVVPGAPAAIATDSATTICIPNGSIPIGFGVADQYSNLIGGQLITLFDVPNARFGVTTAVTGSGGWVTLPLRCGFQRVSNAIHVGARVAGVANGAASAVFNTNLLWSGDSWSTDRWTFVSPYREQSPAYDNDETSDNWGVVMGSFDDTWGSVSQCTTLNAALGSAATYRGGFWYQMWWGGSTPCQLHQMAANVTLSTYTSTNCSGTATATAQSANVNALQASWTESATQIVAPVATRSFRYDLQSRCTVNVGGAGTVDGYLSVDDAFLYRVP